MKRTLSLRELNRTTLARQMLLQRQSLSPLAVVEHLIGLQAQIPNPPYIGLWTRLENTRRDDLTRLMEARQVARVPWLRSTLHDVTAADHQRFQKIIEPALSRGLRSFFGRKINGLEPEKLIAAAKPFLEEAPRTTGELKTRLLEIEPEADADAMAYLIRTYLPIVQVPPGGTWGKGSLAAYTTAASWFDDPTPPQDLKSLFQRYLAAFGPASVMDFQTWTGITKLKGEIDPWKGEFALYKDEDGKELFDLPDAQIMPPDSPAPVRFIPEYDNLLIAQADRRRIIADEDRSRVFLSAGRVQPTILVDGFVRGTWKTERAKDTAALIITPFTPLAESVQEALMAEGQGLIRFIEDEAATYEVRFAE